MPTCFAPSSNGAAGAAARTSNCAAPEVTALGTGELAAALFLLHEFDDLCEATLYQTLEIDISPITDAARDVANEPHGEIVLTLDGGSPLQEYLTVTYAFSLTVPDGAHRSHKHRGSANRNATTTSA